MKKTIPTSINHILFYIEEDAYPKLEAYLRDIRAYFSSYPDSSEIIGDIEARIQEQLLENTTERIVTQSHIDRLIKQMGQPAEFGTPPGDEPVSPSPKTRKKFYRNSEDKVIAGVASGIATYFGIDPLIVRIIFFISIFFGGVGIIGYLFVWVVTKEAKTATEKLEMQGDPVTLDEVKKIVQEKINEAGTKENIRGAGTAFAQQLIGVLGTLAKRTFAVVGAIVGYALQTISILAVVALVIVLGIALVSPVNTLITIGVSLVGSLPFLYLGFLIVFIIALIPILFVHALGNIFLNKKPFANTSLPVVLLTTWIVAIVIATVFFFTTIAHIPAQIDLLVNQY